MAGRRLRQCLDGALSGHFEYATRATDPTTVKQTDRPSQHQLHPFRVCSVEGLLTQPKKSRSFRQYLRCLGQLLTEPAKVASVLHRPQMRW